MTATPSTPNKMPPSQLAAQTAVRELEPPKVLSPLYDQSLQPTDIESAQIREMYEWEKQSARVQFRMA